MKDKMKSLISKTKSYYTPSEEIPVVSPQKELKLLRKENALMKQDFFVQVYSTYKQRRSVRSFSNHQVDEKTLYECIDAASNAPVAGNLQNFSVILIKNIEAKKEVAKICLNQYWMCNAPVIAVVVRNDTQLLQVYPHYGERYSLQNVSAFITSFILMIHSAGYSTCWVGASEEDVLKDYLNVPSSHSIDAILPIGYPLEVPSVDKIDVQDLCYFEKFKQKKK